MGAALSSRHGAAVLAAAAVVGAADAGATGDPEGSAATETCAPIRLDISRRRASEEPTRSPERIVRLEVERFNDIIAADAALETIRGGHMWTEGPAVIDHLPTPGSFFIFSDVKKNAAYSWQDGETSVFLNPSGCHAHAPANADSGVARCQGLVEPGSNGLLVLPPVAVASEFAWDTTVVACEHGNRRVAANVVTLEQPADDGGGGTTSWRHTAATVLAETYQGRRLNSPNDLARHPVTGDIFFTDPPYGLNGKEDDDACEQGFAGVYHIDGAYARARVQAARAGQWQADGDDGASVPLREPALIMADLARPNGVAFSADGQLMYVSNSDKSSPDTRVLKVFDVAWEPAAESVDTSAPSSSSAFAYTVTNGRVFARADDARAAALDEALDASSYHGNFDGVKVDAHGNVFSAGPGGVHVYGADGAHLGAVLTGAKTGNIALGGDGFIYIAADTTIKRVAWHRPAPGSSSTASGDSFNSDGD